MDKKEYDKQRYIDNKEKRLEQMKKYRQSPKGRATHLLYDYNREDRKYNRGKGDLTAEWIVDNIFSQPCVHCGESDWRKIGCNRLDNSKPHTIDNVEPCCRECNLRLSADDKAKQVYQYSLDGKLVRVWESAMEAGRNGFDQGAVSRCCLGNVNKYKNYKWSYERIYNDK